MKIQIKLPRKKDGKTITIKGDTSIKEILINISIKPDTCLTLINNKPVPIDTIIKEGEKLTLLEVTSGG